ncbi:hypothetical protein JCM5350_005696 [Sporobolomyces pararoseus]
MASNSNSQTPSILPPTRYFDLLPTELLRDIFSNLDDTPRTEGSQKTLLSLCLTSKLCRSHAYPLLLKRIHTSIGDYPELLQKLVENNSDASISMTEGFHFDTQDLKNIKKWLVRFIQKATNLREVYVVKQVTPLKAFFGSNITTLSLDSITMKLDGAILSFPELVKLSMFGCPIHNDGGLRFSLPKLRHLGFFWGSESHLFQQQYDFLEQIAPTLVSLTINIGKITTLPPSILHSRSLAVLWEYSFRNRADSITLQGVRHLLLRSNSMRLKEWGELIANSGHQLETLTMDLSGKAPWSKLQSGGSQSLVAACKARSVEILQANDGTSNTFDDLVPSSFIKRLEALRSTV